jgi:hypothetical protein
MKEPVITVNGEQVSEAEAMTIRVALSCYAMDLENENALGSDVAGREIRGGYIRCIHALFRRMGMLS